MSTPAPEAVAAAATKTCVACGPDPQHTNAQLWRCERCGIVVCILGVHAKYRGDFAGHVVDRVRDGDGGHQDWTRSPDGRLWLCGPAIMCSDEAFGAEEAAQRRQAMADQATSMIRDRMQQVHSALCGTDHTDPADPLNPSRKLNS